MVSSTTIVGRDSVHWFGWVGAVAATLGRKGGRKLSPNEKKYEFTCYFAHKKPIKLVFF
jgi:hypothetical protein